MMDYQSDLAQALKILVEYLNGKGQLPPIDRVVYMILYEKALEYFTGREIVNIDKLVLLSIHSPAYKKPLWLDALTQLAQINSKTEVITQVDKKKPILGR